PLCAQHVIERPRLGALGLVGLPLLPAPSARALRVEDHVPQDAEDPRVEPPALPGEALDARHGAGHRLAHRVPGPLRPEPPPPPVRQCCAPRPTCRGMPTIHAATPPPSQAKRPMRATPRALASLTASLAPSAPSRRPA